MKGCLLNYFRAMILLSLPFSIRETVPWCGCPAPQVLSSGGMPNPLHDRLSPALNHLTLWGIRYTLYHQTVFVWKGKFKRSSLMKLIQIAIGSLGHWGSPSFWTATCRYLHLQAEPTAFPSLQPLGSGWRDGKPHLTWQNPSYAVGLEVPKGKTPSPLPEPGDQAFWTSILRPKQMFHSFSVEPSVWGWKCCAPRIQWFIILHPQHSSQSLGQDSRPTKQAYARAEDAPNEQNRVEFRPRPTSMRTPQNAESVNHSNMESVASHAPGYPVHAMELGDRWDRESTQLHIILSWGYIPI